ncbi:integrase [Schaedlerella arabinosiphila]|uniref:Integrase n=1 Tax=Schaedlerella arabinosiphila TaxID=2044587 RepID=A0A3R8KS11_9FIRM|nr:tyrosine-type recombinase/integrase [Schaedlerella arabinosiphila]RRK30509.1 integrase [Schaedlerella arabinosiphila]RRK32388.1 integrase [Schaedlerella arabinosiphila]
MSKAIKYKSTIAGWITGFIDEKKSLGYKYHNESKWMKQFDAYWTDQGYEETGLTPENLSGWVKKRDTEGEKCLTARISIIRQFSMYLNSLGISSYCPPIEVRPSKPVIHLPVGDEIAELFIEIDRYTPGKGNADVRRMSNEYPVLFRLVYLNGLRASEARLLSMDDVDLYDGTVMILDGKGNRDRIIYLSDDMVKLCREYISYLTGELAREPAWLFPGIDPDKPMSYESISSMFRRCWRNTSFSSGCDRNPTTHCLRHAYVVNRINLWREQGLDFEHMLPYLSRFLGHKSFNDTYYYYHYVEDAAQTIRKRDSVIDRVIPEVMRR